jgi:type IV secretion system protein VirD4
LVIDPKGELAAETRAHRAKEDRLVMCINPFDALKLGSTGYNPLADLEPTRDFIDDCMGLAQALIRIEGNDPHWAASAQDLVCALIMYVRLEVPAASLRHVRDILGLRADELRKLILEPHVTFRGKRIRGLRESADVKDWPELAAKASRYADITPDSRELLSIISSALTQTSWIDSRPMSADLSRSGFDFSRMKHEPITVYLILPANRLGSHSTWLRLMITSILQPLMRDTKSGEVPILFMLDEFDQLGHLPIIENTMAMMRGYGIKLWSVFQDLAQAKAIYRDKSDSFIGNAGVLQSFAPQDTATSEYLSALAGSQTVTPLATANANNPQPTFSMGQSQRPLILPQELRRMEDGYSILFSHKLNGAATRAYMPFPWQMRRLQAIANIPSGS